MITNGKYEYLLCVWGGFWNRHNYEIHKEPGIRYRWFDTPEERKVELERLQQISDKLKKDRAGSWDATIASACYEGYLTRFEVIIQTHLLYEGHIHIVENNLGYGFGMNKDDFDPIGVNYDYMKEWKWDIHGNNDVIPDFDKGERLFTTVLLR